MGLKIASPIFVGGTNGSGTRVYAALLERAGVFQGEAKNYANEPANIIQYTRPLVPQLISETGAAVYEPEDLRHKTKQRMAAWLNDISQEIVKECPPGFERWGWKHPRNLFLLPLLNEVFEDCYFVHVVRDGRDMAFAANTGDADAMFHSLFGRDRVDEVDTTAFWSAGNVQVAEWGAARLGRRYISSRFEDLCADPAAEMARIADAVGLIPSPSALKAFGRMVRVPVSIGRWREAPENMQSLLNTAGLAGLQRFGYVV